MAPLMSLSALKFEAPQPLQEPINTAAAEKGAFLAAVFQKVLFGERIIQSIQQRAISPSGFLKVIKPEVEQAHALIK